MLSGYRDFRSFFEEYHKSCRGVDQLEESRRGVSGALLSGYKGFVEWLQGFEEFLRGVSGISSRSRLVGGVYLRCVDQSEDQSSIQKIRKG